MNVLSLFDGISCAKVALDNLGVKIENYFSSEIDPHAIKVSKKNHPSIVQLGDIRNIDVTNLPKIDLLIGGSPCQDLSIAKNGKGLDGKKSGLFFEYLRIFNETNPTYFLLENVKNKWGNKMSEYLDTPFVEINSGLFSAQSRPRYYWTNLDTHSFPRTLNKSVLRDVVSKDVDEKYFVNKDLSEFISTVKLNKNISKDGLIKLFTVPRTIINDNDRQRRVFSVDGKSPTLLARADTTKILTNNRIRKLTPLECERLQGLPDNYTSVISDTQRYKSIGNGFTVPVIEYFLKNISKPPVVKKLNSQINLFEVEVH